MIAPLDSVGLPKFRFEPAELEFKPELNSSSVHFGFSLTGSVAGSVQVHICWWVLELVQVMVQT
jgi:hypothetical protein